MKKQVITLEVESDFTVDLLSRAETWNNLVIAANKYLAKLGADSEEKTFKVCQAHAMEIQPIRKPEQEERRSGTPAPDGLGGR